MNADDDDDDDDDAVASRQAGRPAVGVRGRPMFASLAHCSLHSSTPHRDDAIIHCRLRAALQPPAHARPRRSPLDRARPAPCCCCRCRALWSAAAVCRYGTGREPMHMLPRHAPKRQRARATCAVGHCCCDLLACLNCFVMRCQRAASPIFGTAGRAPSSSLASCRADEISAWAVLVGTELLVLDLWPHQATYI